MKKNMFLPKESLELFKIFKHITAASKIVHFDVLNDIDDNYNNTYHTIIKMKSIDVNLIQMLNIMMILMKKNRKLEVGDHVGISKYKKIFAKGYNSNWSEEVSVISKIKNTVRWTYVFNDLNDEEIIGKLSEKELQKTNQKNLDKKK